MKQQHDRLWEQHAIRWTEHLVGRGENDAAASLLRAVARGIDDEGALEEAVAKTGATLEQVYEVSDATVYRLGNRVRLPENPCTKSWDPTRPCVRASGDGHNGSCELADVNLAQQRKVHAQFAEEMGRVVAAAARRL